MRSKHSRVLPLLLLALAAAGCDAETTSLEAIEDLRRPDSERLRRSLREGRPELRARAALAAGRIQSASYAPELAAAAEVGDTTVRLAALFALGQLGLAEDARPPDAALEACVRGCDDPDPEISAAAAAALGKLAQASAVDKLVSLLKHPVPAVRREAAFGLFRARFVPLWRKQADAAPALPAAAVNGLIENLSDPDDEVRWSSVYAFSRYPQLEAAGPAARLVQDPNEWVRLFAIRSMGKAGDPAIAAALEDGLDDPSHRVRAEAVASLQGVGAVDRLAPDLVTDPSFHVRAALARALADSASEATLDALGVLSGDASPTVRAAALASRARRLGVGHRDDVARRLDDPSWILRAAASRAAGHLGTAGVALLQKALADPDPRVVTAALETAGTLDDGEDLVPDFLGSSDLAVRGTAVTLLESGDRPDKLALLEDAYDRSAGVEWIEIREAIVEAVAGVDGAPRLLTRVAAEDPAPSVRTRARRILSDSGVELPDPTTVPRETSPYLSVRFERDPVVVLETDKGEIVIRCLADQAPVHVASFVKLVGDGFYDGLIWHRVVSNFVIQGGDPRGDGWGSAGFTLRDEINTQRFVRGAVGMPKAGKDTGGCQLFITHVPTPHLDGNYTVFGLVTSGMDVVDRIEVGDAIITARVQ